MRFLFEALNAARLVHGLVPVLLDAALKGAAVLVLAALAATALKRASSASRHLVWALSLIALCVLPVLSAAPVGWPAPILPKSPWSTMAESLAQPRAISDPFRAEVDPEHILAGRSRLETAGPSEQLPRARSSSLLLGLANWIVIVWAGGASVVLARLAASFVGLSRRRREGALLTEGTWISLAEHCARRYGIRRRVSWRLASDGTIPATWGFWRPAGLLPADALDWPEQRKSAVLLHELAHVARGDFLVQTLARLACALHWFNPLVWYADRRLRRESEQASDDLALRAGLAPADYASQLVEVLLAVRREREVPLSALAMARRNELEDRVRAILDGRRSRSGPSRRGIVLMALPAACVLFLFGLIRVEARGHDAPRLERLPEGMTIEILGISTYPSEKPTWWGPDGTPLAEAPCDPPTAKPMGAGPEVRVIVARIKGIPEGSKLTWHPTQCHSQRISLTRKGGRPVADLQTVIGEFQRGPATCDLHFDLSFGEWTVEQTWDGKMSLGVSKEERGFFLGKAREIRDGTALTVAHNIADAEMRLIAIGEDGHELEPRYFGSGGAGHLSGLDAEFSVPPGKIREYRLLSRRVGRYDIKKVSLEPAAR